LIFLPHQFISKMAKYCYLLVFLFVNSLELKAGTIALKNAHRAYDLSKDMQILVDEPATLTFRDVLKRTANFKRMEQPVLNLGPSDVAVWVRFELRNDVGKEWFLHIGAPFLAEIDLYRIYGREGFVHSQISSARPFAERPDTDYADDIADECGCRENGGVLHEGQEQFGSEGSAGSSYDAISVRAKPVGGYLERNVFWPYSGTGTL
jgi:hypothetical protein